MADTHTHDVVVIGSGCTGGTAAWQLSRRGLRVLVLEAGDSVTAADSHPNQTLGSTLRRLWRVLVARSQRVQSLHPCYWVHPPELFVDDRAHPYSTPDARPFVWIRGRQVGGRSLTWSGLTLRLSPYELKEWPIRYEDLAPYYDEVERLMGICGAKDDLSQLPDGDYRAAKPFTPAEALFKQRIAARWSDRHVVNGRGVDHSMNNGWSLKTSPGSTLGAAEVTGLVEVRPNSVARRLVTDDATGRVSAIEIVDRQSRVSTRIPARAVVVCASTLESVRLLLNSASAAHPTGLGNSSGLLGRFIMNKVSRSVMFQMGVDGAETLHPLSSSDSFVVPRYINLDQPHDGLRGGFGVWGAIQRMPLSPTLAIEPGRSALGLLVGYGECLPYHDNRVALDASAPDEWGVPTLHIDVHWRDNERLMAARIQDDLRAMVDAAGGRLLERSMARDPLTKNLLDRVLKAGAVPGTYVHEVGGARMGTSHEDGVVDGHCQLWDCNNVFVTDGACWPTGPWQNPTLTMMAITARSCAAIADRFAAGEL
jgi:choline dehydrogenase-like flavoprotein